MFQFQNIFYPPCYGNNLVKVRLLLLQISILVGLWFDQNISMIFYILRHVTLLHQCQCTLVASRFKLMTSQSLETNVESGIELRTTEVTWGHQNWIPNIPCMSIRRVSRRYLELYHYILANYKRLCMDIYAIHMEQDLKHFTSWRQALFTH